MPKTNTVTEAQLNTIARRATDHEADALRRTGCSMSYEQADAIGDEGMDWLRTRLGLTVRETDAGVECLPA